MAEPTGIDTALLIAASGISALVLLRPAAQSQIRISRRPRPRTTPAWLTRSIGAVGAAVAIASPAGATERKGGSPHRPIPVAPVQPWSETGGGSPPAPPVRAQARPFEADEGARSGDLSTLAPGTEEPTSETGETPRLHPARGAKSPRDPARKQLEKAEVTARSGGTGKKGASSGMGPSSVQRHLPSAPRAVHPTQRTAALTPLFPRAGKPDRITERRACMGRHPSAGNMRQHRRYTVRPGDTLWDISAEVLGTDEPSRIARYWPRVHRANRAAIGSNPHLLIPGTVLTLPDEGCSR